MAKYPHISNVIKIGSTRIGYTHDSHHYQIRFGKDNLKTDSLRKTLNIDFFNPLQHILLTIFMLKYTKT